MFLTDLLKLRIRLGIMLALVAFQSVCVVQADESTLQNARVIVHIQDEFRASGKVLRISERLLQRLLRQAGFSVLNAAQVAKLKERDEVLYFLDGDGETSTAIDLQQDADYVVRGRGVVSSGKRIFNSQMRPRHANVGFEIYSTDTGQVIYSSQFSSVSSHIDEVAGGKKALQTAVRESMNDVLRVLRSQENRKKIKQYELVVANLSSYSNFRALQQSLKDAAFGVEVISYTDGLGRLYVSSDVSITQLADSVEGMVVKGNRLEIIDLSKGRVQARVVDPL